MSNPGSAGGGAELFRGFVAVIEDLTAHQAARAHVCARLCVHVCAHACARLARAAAGRQQDGDPASSPRLKSSSCRNPAGTWARAAHGIVSPSSGGGKQDFSLRGGNTVLQTPYTHADNLLTSLPTHVPCFHPVLPHPCTTRAKIIQGSKWKLKSFGKSIDMGIPAVTIALENRLHSRTV